MKRESLFGCPAFRSLDAAEIGSFLSCVAARYRRLHAGRSLSTKKVVIVLSGRLSANGGSPFAESEIAFGGSAPVRFDALCDSELLLIDRERLFSLCKNACLPHRIVIRNLADEGFGAALRRSGVI